VVAVSRAAIALREAKRGGAMYSATHSTHNLHVGAQKTASISTALRAGGVVSCHGRCSSTRHASAMLPPRSRSGVDACRGHIFGA